MRSQQEWWCARFTPQEAETKIAVTDKRFEEMPVKERKGKRDAF